MSLKRCPVRSARGGRARRLLPVWLALLVLALLPAFGGTGAPEEENAASASVMQGVLPAPFYEIDLLGLGLWQWLGALILVAASLVISWLLGWVVYRIGRRIAARTDTSLDDRLVALAVSPLRYLIALVFFSTGSLFLELPDLIDSYLTGLVRALGVAVIGWLVFRLIDLGVDLAREHFEEQGQTAVLPLLPLGRKGAKVVLLLLCALAILQNLGFHVTGIIAGLGVGGLAVALAAQKTIENLFGGATLLADRPVRVGDFCKFGDKMGTVEEIGLRSTRIRSLDRTLITIPNGDFSQTQLENFGVRDRIRLFLMVGLRYETTPDQLRHVLAGLRRVLLAHPRLARDPARVRFVGFGAYSLDLEVFTYAVTKDWNDFLAIREDVLLRFIDVVAESGTGFAFPSQTTYLSRDPGLGKEEVQRVEAEVEAWRREGRLPFPNFSSAAQNELHDTLDWPPRGAMTEAASG